MHQQTPRYDFEILRSMFAGTIHNIGNILTMANLAVNELENSNSGKSPPVLDMILTEMLPTLEEQVAKGTINDFLANDPQGSEYLQGIKELLQYQRDVIINQKMTIEQLSDKMNHINSIISLQQQLLMGIGTEEEIILDQVIDDAIRMTVDSARRHGIDLTCKLNRTTRIYTDPCLMTQVLINIIKNAIEALDAYDYCENGRKHIDIRTAMCQHEGTDFAIVTISDNGPGMSEDIMHRIYDLGFSTKKRAAGERGIGLHFCHKTMTKFGGRIEVKSQLDQGTTFSLWLPPHAAQSPAKGSGKTTKP